MKLIELKGEAAIVAMADCIDPLVNISADKALMEKKGSMSSLDFIKELLRTHPSDIICLLAAMEQKPVDEFKETVNFATLPSMLIELLEDPLVKQLFPLQSQNTEETSSGSVMENTEVKEN